MSSTDNSYPSCGQDQPCPHDQIQTAMKKSLISILFILGIVVTAQAQYTTLNAHSHNDYEQKIPFFTAYNAHFGSIEADIWAVNGVLFVAHDSVEITPARTLDALYLQPIVKLFHQNGGKAWKNHPSRFWNMVGR